MRAGLFRRSGSRVRPFSEAGRTFRCRTRDRARPSGRAPRSIAGRAWNRPSRSHEHRQEYRRRHKRIAVDQPGRSHHADQCNERDPEISREIRTIRCRLIATGKQVRHDRRVAEARRCHQHARERADTEARPELLLAVIAPPDHQDEGERHHHQRNRPHDKVWIERDEEPEPRRHRTGRRTPHGSDRFPIYFSTNPGKKLTGDDGFHQNDDDDGLNGSEQDREDRRHQHARTDARETPYQPSRGRDAEGN